MRITEKAKNAALQTAIGQGLHYLEKDPETNIPKLMHLIDKLTPDDWYPCPAGCFPQCHRIQKPLV